MFVNWKAPAVRVQLELHVQVGSDCLEPDHKKWWQVPCVCGFDLQTLTEQVAKAPNC